MKRSLKYFVTTAICAATLITGTIPAFAAEKTAYDVISSDICYDIILDQNGTVWAYRPAAGGYAEKKVVLETNVLSIHEFGNVMVHKKDGTLWEIDFRNSKDAWDDYDPFDGFRKLKIAQNARTVSEHLGKIHTVTNNNAYYVIQRKNEHSTLASERYSYQKMMENVAKMQNGYLYLTTDGKLYAKDIYIDVDHKFPCGQTPKPAEWTLVDTNVKDFQATPFAGSFSSYFYIKNDGTLYGWGNNTYGELGSRRFGSYGIIGVGSPTPGEEVSVLMFDYDVEKIMDGVDRVEINDYVFVYKKDGSIWQMGSSTPATATVNEKGALLAPKLPNDGKPVKVDAATVRQYDGFYSGVTERTYKIDATGGIIVSGPYAVAKIPDPQNILPYLWDMKTVTNHKINGITVSLN